MTDEGIEISCGVNIITITEEGIQFVVPGSQITITSALTERPRDFASRKSATEPIDDACAR